MKVRYLATATGQNKDRCGINVVVGRTADGAAVWSGVREYTRGEVYLVSDELGAALIRMGGFEAVVEQPVVVEAEKPKRRVKGEEE